MRWHQRILCGALAAMTSSFVMLAVASTAHIVSSTPFLGLA
ncbi:MAG: hypothetical protein SFV20_13270 [Sphingopyxis sp.]|nr:hypothetical protein [Sphingopyxis sp.]